MSFAVAVLYFVFGTIVGSFLNVVILRYGAWTLAGRSVCSSCGKRLSWHELVPILSFLYLRGRCRSCKSRISLQYPLVELATGLLFMGTYYTGHVGLPLFFSLVLISGFVVIFVYDLYHKIIPNGLVYLCIGVSFVSMFLSGPMSSLSPLLHVAAGPVLFLPFFLLWFFSKGTWMGLGDAKLALTIGWFLGLSKGFTVVIGGFWMGALVSLLLVAFQKISFNHATHNPHALTLRSEIPFAPFLIVSFFLVFFFDIDIWEFILVASW